MFHFKFFSSANIIYRFLPDTVENNISNWLAILKLSQFLCKCSLHLDSLIADSIFITKIFAILDIFYTVYLLFFSLFVWMPEEQLGQPTL